MSWHWSGISLLLLAGAGYLTACAVYVWRYRRGPTAASLVVVLAALAQVGRGARRRARRWRPGDRARLLRSQVRRPGGAGAGRDCLRAPVRRLPAAAETGAAWAVGAGAGGGPGGAGDPGDPPPVPDLPAVAGAQRCPDGAVWATVLGPLRLLQHGDVAVPGRLSGDHGAHLQALLPAERAPAR